VRDAPPGGELRRLLRRVGCCSPQRIFALRHCKRARGLAFGSHNPGGRPATTRSEPMKRLTFTLFVAGLSGCAMTPEMAQEPTAEAAHAAKEDVASPGMYPAPAPLAARVAAPSTEAYDHLPESQFLSVADAP